MARQYSRREFLMDASFTFATSVLLKVLAPANYVMPREDSMERAKSIEEKTEGQGRTA